MARTPIVKEFADTKLASTYGSWIYCGSCGKSVGYLCYVTYDSVRFEYRCKCGGHGSMHLAFRDTGSAQTGDSKLVAVKNRLCCPADQSPLFTVLSKNLESYRYDVVCSRCGTRYLGGQQGLPEKQYEIQE